MKRTLIVLWAAIALGCFALAGCESESDKSASAEAESKALTYAELDGKNFSLVSLDGQTFGGERAPVLNFGDDKRVSGSFCNRFTGEGILEYGVLTVNRMAMTKMLCTDSFLENLERVVPQMLADGAKLSLEGDTLTMSQGGHTAVYKLENQGNR